MPKSTAKRLQQNIDKILTIWEERTNREVAAAHHQHKLALRNSLPEYLNQLSDALSKKIDRTAARERSDKIDSTRIGKKHGEDRAGSKNYTITHLITEYHILRQVVCDVLEEEAPLTDIEYEVIVSSIEQAVNDAATEYTDILNNIKERVSNTLAHDLRNPLTSTKISAELILRKLSPDDSLAPKMKIIVNNMNRLDKMIVELLDANRLEAGQSMPIELKLCDFEEIVREVINELSLSHLDCFNLQTKGKCEGYWDASGLRRIVENLLSNALKYGAEHSTITISLSQDEKFAELSVHNSGKPIPEKEIPILFQQYRRSKSSEEKQGWGLGLTMVKGMVEAHNGSVQVESDQDIGTTFKIKLPKDARTEIVRKTAEQAEQPSHTEQVAQVPMSEERADLH